MRPKHVAEALETLIDIKQPTFIHGSPGVGKSQLVASVCKKLNLDFIDLRLSQLDPVDLRGIPSVVKGMTKWNPPDFLPTEGKGVLFLDELNSAAQATQAASYQLVLDRRLGDYELPKDWTIIAAGNRASDRAIVNQMSTALKNRFTHLQYDVNNDDWINWAINSNINVGVLGFIRFRPSALNEFETAKGDKAKHQNIKDAQAFATPRSWEFLSRIMDTEPSKDIEHDLYQGTVGEGAAIELMGYLKYQRDLPDIDLILTNPDKVPVPGDDKIAARFAVVTSLAARVNEKNIANATKYVGRLPVEFQVLMMKDAVARNNKIGETRAFVEWIHKNQNVML